MFDDFDTQIQCEEVYRDEDYLSEEELAELFTE